MSAEMKKGYTSTLILIGLGVLVLYLGPEWLMLVIPAAILAWYSARAGTFRRNDN
jgi:4-amino-4-deoxy-L-arabinose transferase-like glycosyltransferase